MGTSYRVLNLPSDYDAKIRGARRSSGKIQQLKYSAIPLYRIAAYSATCRSLPMYDGRTFWAIYFVYIFATDWAWGTPSWQWGRKQTHTILLNKTLANLLTVVASSWALLLKCGGAVLETISTPAITQTPLHTWGKCSQSTYQVDIISKSADADVFACFWQRGRVSTSNMKGGPTQLLHILLCMLASPSSLKVMSRCNKARTVLPWHN